MDLASIRKLNRTRDLETATIVAATGVSATMAALPEMARTKVVALVNRGSSHDFVDLVANGGAGRES